MNTGKVCSIDGRNGTTLDIPTRLENMTSALKAPELARILGMGHSAIYDLAGEGRIPHYRIGTSLRFDPMKIAAWLREREIGAVRKTAA
jgi:excisionase family DNA binding protein